MNLKPILLAALAVSALLAGAAGTVAAQPDNTDDNASDAGPPGDLPEPVPDFVGDILGSIGDFLDGVLSSVGDAVSGIAAGR